MEQTGKLFYFVIFMTLVQKITSNKANKSETLPEAKFEAETFHSFRKNEDSNPHFFISDFVRNFKFIKFVFCASRRRLHANVLHVIICLEQLKLCVIL